MLVKVVSNLGLIVNQEYKNKVNDNAKDNLNKKSVKLFT